MLLCSQTHFVFPTLSHLPFPGLSHTCTHTRTRAHTGGKPLSPFVTCRVFFFFFWLICCCFPVQQLIMSHFLPVWCIWYLISVLVLKVYVHGSVWVLCAADSGPSPMAPVQSASNLNMSIGKMGTLWCEWTGENYANKNADMLLKPFIAVGLTSVDS